MLRLEMPNPWLKLAAKPYVLPEDADLVAMFNATADAKHRIDLNVFPDPFVGSPAAPIWLLNLNPGLQQTDYHHPQHVVEMQRRSIALEAENFWYLDDKFSGTSGYDWWRKKTRNACGIGFERSLAAGGTEIIGSALMLNLSRGRSFIDGHAAYRIGGHRDLSD